MGKINAAVQLTQNRFLNLFKLFAGNKNGEALEYLGASRAEKVDDLKAISHKKKADAVAIVAWHKESQRFVLLKQYRYAIGDYVYELPAGLVEDGEFKPETDRITNWCTVDTCDYDYDDKQLFAVFSKLEIRAMITVLEYALSDCSFPINRFMDTYFYKDYEIDEKEL